MKKILSIFLAILMAFSCLTVSFASQVESDLIQYTPSKVNYHLFPKKSAEKLADRCTSFLSALIDAAFKADPDFDKVDDIVSNKSLKYFFMVLFEDMTPAECATILPQDCFIGAKEVLSTAQSWEDVTFENGDFDFIDGDFDGFLDSIFFIVYVWDVTYDKKVFSKLNLHDEGVRIAYEEKFVTLFEFLGIKAVPWEEIMERTENQENEQVVFYSTIMKPIVKAVLDLFKNPGDMLWDFIVRVCYILDTDMVNKLENDTTQKQEPVFAAEEDYHGIISALNSSGLYNFVVEKDIPLFEGLSEEQFVRAIHDIAGCGTVVVDSIQPLRATIEADKGKTVVCIFNTILDWQKTKEFAKAIVEPLFPNKPITRTFCVVYMMLYARFMPRALAYGEFSLLLLFVKKAISVAAL